MLASSCTAWWNSSFHLKQEWTSGSGTSTASVFSTGCKQKGNDVIGHVCPTYTDIHTSLQVVTMAIDAARESQHTDIAKLLQEYSYTH